MSLQLELTGLSSNSPHVIAEGSGHSVMIDQPEAVVNAVRQVVEAARGK